MSLINWDISLFEFINNDLSNSFFDILLPLLRQPYFWLPLYVFIAVFAFFNYGRKAYWFLIFLILTVSTSDILSSRAIKKNVARIRPCNTEHVHVIERVPCGSGYSFTSSHAANHFAVATFLVLTLGQRFRKINMWLWIWAGSVAFAQVYVGVHYPLDVLGGALFGLLVGKFWASLYFYYYGNIFVTKLKE